MGRQCLPMPCIRIGTHRLAACGMREGGIEVEFRSLHQHDRQRRRCRKPLFRLFRGIDSGCVVASEEASLQLPDPVEAFGQGQSRVTGEARLERVLREQTHVERAEFRGFAAEHAHEREQDGDHVGSESEPYRARKLQSLFCFALDPIEWIARSEKSGTGGAAGVCRKRRVALLVRHLKGTSGRIDSFPERSCPWHHEREDEIGFSTHALQPATLGQIAGHLAKPIACVVMAEAVAGDKPDRDVMRRRGVAVAVLQAEIHRPADGERVQILVGV